jgi:HSP20 family molecular chaperone IbpA
MSNQKEMAKQEVQAKIPHRSVRPNVDIFEDGTGITVMADLPGVSKEGLDIQVDDEILSIDGCVDVRLPEGMDENYAEFRATRYQRSFSLGSELD